MAVCQVCQSRHVVSDSGNNVIIPPAGGYNHSSYPRWRSGYFPVIHARKFSGAKQPPGSCQPEINPKFRAGESAGVVDMAKRGDLERGAIPN